MRTMSSLASLLLFAVTGSADAPTQVNGFGVPSAPILMEVYSDFQCEGCKAFHTGTLQEVYRDYVAKGKVYLIHHEFPLPGHAYARPAAEYACAAGRIGQYRRVADALFANQESWVKSGKVEETVCAVLTPDQAKRVRALAKDPAIKAAVDRQFQTAMASGLRSTPTVIVTHRLKRYPLPGGAVKYEFMRRFLDGLLDK